MPLPVLAAAPSRPLARLQLRNGAPRSSRSRALLRTVCFRDGPEPAAPPLAHPTAGTVRVSFAFPCQTRFGENVAVVGSFSGWDTAAPLKLEWSEGGIWRGEAELPAGEHVEYKYIRRSEVNGSVTWQPGGNQVLDLEGEGPQALLVRDDWLQHTHQVELAPPALTDEGAAPAAEEEQAVGEDFSPVNGTPVDSAAIPGIPAAVASGVEAVLLEEAEVPAQLPAQQEEEEEQAEEPAPEDVPVAAEVEQEELAPVVPVAAAAPQPAAVVEAVEEHAAAPLVATTAAPQPAVAAAAAQPVVASKSDAPAAFEAGMQPVKQPAPATMPTPPIFGSLTTAMPVVTVVILAVLVAAAFAASVPLLIALQRGILAVLRTLAGLLLGLK